MFPEFPDDQQLVAPSGSAAQELERRLTATLEMRPDPVISPDFALRVAAKLPAARQQQARYLALPEPVVGRRVSLVALSLLLAAIFFIALQPQSAQSLALRVVGWSFEAEFVLLTVWLALRPQPLR